MKKYTQGQRHKQYMLRRAERQLKARLRFKRYRSHRNRTFAKLPREDRVAIAAREHRPTKFTEVRAPEVLSFLRNPEGVAAFIAELRECFEKKKPAWVVLRGVKEIDYDAITVLLSVVVRFKAKRIQFNGDFPRDSLPRHTLEASGFFEHLHEGKFQERDSYKLDAIGTIHTHAKKNVDPELGAVLIETATPTVWGAKRRCPGVQRAFIELMQNTNNHAAPEGEEEKHWWLSVNRIKKEKRVTFSFVDYGVGVFYSLENKPAGNKFFNALSLLRQKFTVGDNTKVLELIFKGELHKTVTGKPYRGKGLPGVYEAFHKNQISNLAMITNNVYFNSATNEYKLLKHEFQGTFVYWELTPSNSSLGYEP